MRKLPLIGIGLLLLAGGAYALMPNLFPNTNLFPRVPVGDGTIGGVIGRILATTDLANWAGDGTVPKTAKLNGITETGYLRDDTPCGTLGQKWVAITATGHAVCNGSTPVLADYGTISAQDCPATVYHETGTPTFESTSTGQTLKAGDVLKTDPGCTLTIAFTDLSLVRLDGDTVISLDIGYLPNGTTIASALLENGSLWGRILTETGSYSVGTHEIIAGVRGTSISIVSTGNTINSITQTATGWQVNRTPGVYNTYVNIVDSTVSTGAATIICRRPVIGFVNLSDLSPEGSYTVPPGGCGPIMASLTEASYQTFSRSPWIKANTRKDLDYLYKLRSLSGAILTPTKDNIVKNEITVTAPPTLSGTLTATGVLEAGNVCNSGERWWDERYGCQEDTILAIADYSLPIPAAATFPPLSVYTSTGIVDVPATNTPPTPITGRGVNIGLSGLSVTYSPTQIEAILGLPLTGKILYIELNTTPTGSGPKYIFFSDATHYLYYSPGTTSYSCNAGAPVTAAYPIPISCFGALNATNISYKITSPPSSFVIGNNSPTGSQGINAIIEKFIIK